MRSDEYEKMRRLEDGYWWFVSRRKAVLGFIENSVGGIRGRVLDVGCGTGGTLAALEAWPGAMVCGADLARAALAHARRVRRAKLVRADATALPFRDGAFDLITALDLLEHVEHDDAAVAEVARLLAPDGFLVVTVPAYQWLWSGHDEALHHHRRYTRRELARLLAGGGLEVVRLTNLFCALFPAALLSRLVGRFRKADDARSSVPSVPPALNRLLIRWQDLESLVARSSGLPFGLSIIALARRSQG